MEGACAPGWSSVHIIAIVAIHQKAPDYGKFYGTPVVALPQRHKVGSTDFVFADNIITVVAGDDKPIKVVREGDATMIMGDPLKNQDLTQELEIHLNMYE